MNFNGCAYIELFVSPPPLKALRSCQCGAVHQNPTYTFRTPNNRMWLDCECGVALLLPTDDELVESLTELARDLVEGESWIDRLYIAADKLLILDGDLINAAHFATSSRRR